MAETTGIPWTNGTVNFWIGCTKVGPGCDHCYAEEFARRKFPVVVWGPGGARYKTKAGYENPLRWQRAHDKHTFIRDGLQHYAMMSVQGQSVRVPVWVFCNSLSDFFDNEIDSLWRTEAWDVIRRCPSLRWQIVTKRIGNVVKMLPGDWHEGKNYRHVGIISTMVNQDEYDRDAPKLADLYNHGVRWTGISMEPRLGPIKISLHTDWVIDGGESNQGEHKGRPFDIEQSIDIERQCVAMGIPYFRKQLGDHPVQFGGRATKFGSAGEDISKWPAHLRVQQMPTIYDSVVERAGNAIKDLFS